MAVDRDPWQQLLAGVRLPFHPELVIPPLHHIELDTPETTPVDDVEAAATAATTAAFASSITPGTTVAVVRQRQVTRPRRKPRATACARSLTPSLRNSRRAWVLMVSSDR